MKALTSILFIGSFVLLALVLNYLKRLRMKGLSKQDLAFWGVILLIILGPALVEWVVL